MRAISVLILVLLVSFQTVGYLLMQLERLSDTQSAMTEYIQNPTAPSTTERFLLTESTFEQCRVGARELRHNGFLYDIKKMYRTTDGQIQLEVIRDGKEQKILDAICHWVDGDSKQSSNAPSSVFLAHLFTQVYILPRAIASLPAPSETRQAIPTYALEAWIARFQSNIQTPPPETGLM